MKNNIPTTEELVLSNGSKEFWEEFYGLKNKLVEKIIEYTKLHCEAQLKAILDKAKPIHKGYGLFEIDKDSITNAYDLNQIK